MQRKPPAVTNRQIVDELREGNRLGYKHLTERYRRPLLHEAVSVYRVDRDDAEEIVNDVLLLVASRIPGFAFRKSDTDFQSWVVTILRNRIRDHMRKTSSSQYLRSSLDAEVIPDYSFLRLHENESTISILRGLTGIMPDPDGSRGERHEVAQLREILESMPTWQQVLLRCRALDIPYEEIAVYTGKNAKALKVYHARVQKKLRKELEKQLPELAHSQNSSK